MLRVSMYQISMAVVDPDAVGLEAPLCLHRSGNLRPSRGVSTALPTPRGVWHLLYGC